MSELRFSSEEEALQHLSDVTGKQVKIANMDKRYGKDQLNQISRLSEAAQNLVNATKVGEFARDTSQGWKLNLFGDKMDIIGAIIGDMKKGYTGDLKDFDVKTVSVWLKGGGAIEL